MDSSTSSKKVNLCEICKAPAAKRCSCGTAYCSVKCQKMIWYTHKSIHDHNLNFIRQPDVHINEVMMQVAGLYRHDHLDIEKKINYVEREEARTTLIRVNEEANELKPLARNMYLANFRSDLIKKQFGGYDGRLEAAFAPLGSIDLVPFYRISGSQLMYAQFGISPDHSHQLTHLEFVYNSLLFNPNFKKSHDSYSLLQQVNARLYALITSLSNDRTLRPFFVAFTRAARIGVIFRGWEIDYWLEHGMISEEESVEKAFAVVEIKIPTPEDWENHLVF